MTLEDKVEQLSERVYVWNTYPTCAILVTDGGVVAIDAPMLPTEAVAWREFIATKGPLKYQVVCEHHQDHSAAGWFLRPEAIISSEITRAEIPKSIPSIAKAQEIFRQYDPNVTEELIADYQLVLPTITYRHRLTLRLGDQTLVIFEAPGHTRGSTVVHALEERIAFVSDLTVFALHSADVWTWFKSLGVLEALDVDWYVGGHGRPERRERISELRHDLLDLVAKAREMKQTMTRDEFVKSGDALYAHAGIASNRVTPAQIKVRRAMLRKKGLENLYSYLDEHPSGSTFSHQDPEFDVVF